MCLDKRNRAQESQLTAYEQKKQLLYFRGVNPTDSQPLKAEAHVERSQAYSRERKYYRSSRRDYV